MPPVNVNYLAVLVAAVVQFAIGGLWYSPALFAKSWMHMVGLKKESIKKADMFKPMAVSFVGLLVTSYVMAHFLAYMGANTVLAGAITGFWAWLGFAGVTTLVTYMYSNRPFKLFLIDSGYNLVSFVIAGMILAAWR